MGHRRREKLDHPRRALGPDDAARAHASASEGLCRVVDAARPEAARDRSRSLPRQGHERQRDRGARLSRDARICVAVRCDARSRRRAARRRGGAGVQAAHAHLRRRADPDRGARCRGGAARARTRARLCARPQAVRPGDHRFPAGVGQARDEPRRFRDGARAQLCGGAREGQRQALRHRGGDGEAARRTRRLGERRRQFADPRRQWLCARI